MKERTYIAIDLKSFYASVECVERGLNPLTTNLVVADPNRTEKTICLAVSPSLKAFGIPGRARLFEVIQKIEAVNSQRLKKYRNNSGNRRAEFSEKTNNSDILNKFPDMAADYIVASPQMAHYMEVSTQIYKIYLKYAAPEDIHVYSIDEVFIDATSYLPTYGMTAHEFTMTIIRDILASTGITATAGIGTNMYLCKIAMDIVAKHMPADKDGVRIAELDEKSYRRILWNHRPLTDFWRVGRGYSEKLEAAGLFTMGDIARFSLESEDYLYKLFGVNAELLIDLLNGGKLRFEPALHSVYGYDHACDFYVGRLFQLGQHFPERFTGSHDVLYENYPLAVGKLFTDEKPALAVVLYFLSVKAVIHILSEAVKKRHRRGYGKRNTLIGRTDKRVRLYLIVFDTLRVIIAETRKLGARFIVARIYEIRRYSTAFKRKFTESEHAVIDHKFDKLIFVIHIILL